LFPYLAYYAPTYIVVKSFKFYLQALWGHFQQLGNTADDSAGTRFLYADTLLDGTRENFGTLAGSGWPIQPLVILGETVTYESLDIEFTASTGFDSITITAKP